ncbi:hypothetical protein LTR85_007279 [Meristemomyces frigidus]|nr:hypothetical protein LTR85_007279 [Meristemomyces frigidus]
MASRQATTLLRLPAELRLIVYDFYFASHQHYEFFDIANNTSVDNQEPSKLRRHKTYSLIFAHPIIFAEALPIVIKTHVSVFYNTHDLESFAREQSFVFQALRCVELDLGKFSALQMKKALRCIAKAGQLKDVVIDIPRPHRHMDLVIWGGGVCKYCCFPSLVSLEVRDRRAERQDERKEQREQQIREEEDMALAKSRRLSKMTRKIRWKC